jgi:hypothetical protein
LKPFAYILLGAADLVRGLFLLEKNNCNPQNYYRECEPLADGNREEEPVVVGLAEKFGGEARGSVANQIKCRESTDTKIIFPDAPQNHEKQNSFEKHFIELRRVAKLAGEIGREIHSPGGIRCPSV